VHAFQQLCELGRQAGCQQPKQAEQQQFKCIAQPWSAYSTDTGACVVLVAVIFCSCLLMHVRRCAACVYRLSAHCILANFCSGVQACGLCA
jgi:hypothetical protein